MIFHPRRAQWITPPPAGNEVTLAQMDDWDEPVIWVDARSEKEYASEHIPSAISLNPDQFDSNLVHLLEAWTPGTRVVVYCDTLQCDASHEIADRLSAEVGLPGVYVLFEGWAAWQRSGK